MSPTSRVPAGVPTGGQFAATSHAESAVSLTDGPRCRCVCPCLCFCPANRPDLGCQTLCAAARRADALADQTVTGADLPEMAYVAGQPYDPDRFEPVRNQRWTKPAGGLWISPPREDGTTEWEMHLDRSRYEQPRSIRQPIALDPAARVLRIDSLDDLRAALAVYPATDTGGKQVLDYEALARDYDAMWVTRRGVNQTDGRNDRQPRLYPWDLESTVVFRPDAVRAGEPAATGFDLGAWRAKWAAADDEWGLR